MTKKWGYCTLFTQLHTYWIRVFLIYFAIAVCLSDVSDNNAVVHIYSEPTKVEWNQDINSKEIINEKHIHVFVR